MCGVYTAGARVPDVRAEGSWGSVPPFNCDNKEDAKEARPTLVVRAWY